MALRIRVPPLVDVLLVDDPAHMAALNNHESVSRDLLPDGGWLNAFVHARTYGTFTVGDTPLAVFAGRGAPGRAARREALETRLKGAALDPVDVASLSRYVAGAEPPAPIGVLAQGAIGRLFFPDYVASEESYRAATTLASMNPVRMIRGALTGEHERSRRLLWQLAREDLECIHATTLAVHGVADTLRRMRQLMTERRRREPDDGAGAITECLVAPAVLLRSCTMPTTVGFLRRPLDRGTLLVFRLRAMYDAHRDTDLAFSRDEWSRCPAHEVVPRLLETVWREAMRIPLTGARPRSLPSRAFTGAFALLNRAVSWHRLPTVVALANLDALRIVLREKNMHDTETTVSRRRCPVSGWLPRYRHARTADGTYNDLTQPTMGATGTRFGRLVPLGHTVPDRKMLLVPNPRTISHRLLARRHGFVPATTLNLLAAAWIQFQVHDWFSHGEPDMTEPWEVPLEPGDSWPEPSMRIGRTRAEPADPGVPAPTYTNKVTHWWDASQLYGSVPVEEDRVREHRGGRLAVTGSGRLPVDPETGIEVTGFADNWWVGLDLLHTLFALEHNAICDRLRAEQPGWDDEHLFATARLINAALIAKIHTLEWTPALLGHPAVAIGMRGNWWGLAGERLHRLLGRLADSEVVSGIPGSPTDHHGTSFSIPEEFVAVYRMHPLLPDEIVFRSAATGDERLRRSLLEISGVQAHEVLEAVGMTDVFYSFGVACPGALTLGNYPETLRSFRRLNGTLVDVAAADVLRDRERGVPRYNEFRRLFRLPPIGSFDELNPGWAAELRAVYGSIDGRDDVESLDLMIGLLAETPPRGFAFSDTAFRVFILMASRRLKSDRFFTIDYRPEIYTRAGIEWIENNDMKSVLSRHYPELRPVLLAAGNPFAPWPRTV